jgi:putative transposase
MKRSKFTGRQITYILRWAEQAVPQNGVSEATLYAWRKKHAGRMPSETNRLSQLAYGRSPGMLRNNRRSWRVGRHPVSQRPLSSSC